MRFIVCILAHNEELTIRNTVESILLQRMTSDDTMSVYVFTNGCTDQTNEVVAEMAAADARIRLVALPEKGKVYAIRESIACFQGLSDTFDRVFYLDADVALEDVDALRKLSATLDQSTDLYLVSAATSGKQAPWFLRTFDKARFEVQSHHKANVVRGRCYVIRLETLGRVHYHPDILSDDMFLELRLNGHYTVDYSVVALTDIKTGIRKEIRRDLFTQIACHQVIDRHHAGKIQSLDPQTARKEWQFRRPTSKEIFTYFLVRARISSLIVIFVWSIIYRRNRKKAKRLYTERRKKELITYWETAR